MDSVVLLSSDITNVAGIQKAQPYQKSVKEYAEDNQPRRIDNCDSKAARWASAFPAALIAASKAAAESPASL